jgi:hypothetical protein
MLVTGLLARFIICSLALPGFCTALYHNKTLTAGRTGSAELRIPQTSTDKRRLYSPFLQLYLFDHCTLTAEKGKENTRMIMSFQV